jgi:hypothetical protein
LPFDAEKQYVSGAGRPISVLPSAAPINELFYAFALDRLRLDVWPCPSKTGTSPSSGRARRLMALRILRTLGIQVRVWRGQLIHFAALWDSFRGVPPTRRALPYCPLPTFPAIFFRQASSCARSMLFSRMISCRADPSRPATATCTVSRPSAP